MSLKKEIEDILHPERKNLHPPPVIKFEPKEIIIENYGDIDFKAISESSEFRRFIYFLYTGKTHRGTIKQLNKDIKEFQEDAQNVRNYRDVMNEFKELIKKRNENK